MTRGFRYAPTVSMAAVLRLPHEVVARPFRDDEAARGFEPSADWHLYLGPTNVFNRHFAPSQIRPAQSPGGYNDREGCESGSQSRSCEVSNSAGTL
jgi:hypothetical protein